MNWISKFIIVVIMSIWIILSLPLIGLIYTITKYNMMDDMLNIIDKATNN